MLRLAICAVLAAAAAPAQNVELKTAATSPIQYYLSLPDGWTAAKRWPLVIVIESANRQFQETAALYAKARGAMPFILAVPMVVSNGGPNYRQAPGYRYSDADWARIEEAGGCKFDEDGIGAVAADIRKNYSAEKKYFLAGWEAGGHTVWAELFRHPERLQAAALAGPNYQARCAEFSSDPARTDLKVKVFLSSVDVQSEPNRFVHEQTTAAITDGEQHGFQGISIVEIGRPHGPMPEQVLAWFQMLRKP